MVKSPPITDEEVREFYDSHKDRLRVEIRQGLVNKSGVMLARKKKVQERRALLVSSIRSKASIKTFLTPPQMYRANLSVSGAPSKGAEKAACDARKIRGLSVSILQNRATAVLRAAKKVRRQNKNSPQRSAASKKFIRKPGRLRRRRVARPTRESFGSIMTKLYEHSPKAPAETKAYAKEVGLNVTSFERCLRAGSIRAAVQNDLAEGAQLGLTGTPAFFINGREMTGAQPLEAFTAIIDEELALAK